MLIAAVAALLLNGCLYELRRIDLSDSGTSNSRQNVSYLLVDKSDYSAEGQVLVERIDDGKIDLLLDPSVYIVNSGKHTIFFSFNDFRKQNKSEQVLTAILQPGRYYQVMAIRNNGDMRFEASEIPKEKLETVGRREFRSMTNYLLRGEK